MGETATRYLAAILAADVVGYSRLMGADEDATLARVQALFAEVAGPAVAARQGRIFKTMGDAFLAEFPSAVGAVLCAAEVQQALAAREAGRPEAARLRLRVGVHMGDVVPQGTDLFGDGVNIAARLEGVAEPGGVAVSATVADAVRGKLPFGLEDLGERALKNIERPVRVFRLVAAGAAVPKPGGRRLGALATGLVVVALALGGVWWAWRPVGVVEPVELAPAVAAPEAAGPPRLSFVVLPFANRSGDAEQDYFVDGLTDSLTTDLSRLDGSFVISRGSAFTYKGRAVDARQVGRELGVRYVVEGSVLRSGERVRVTAQLVEAESGRQVWADSFDGSRGDMLEMVDSATARLGQALGVQAMERESRQAERPDAADLALRGWAALNRGVTRENYQEAEGYFRRAQALAADNISAANGLAWFHTTQLSQNWVADRAVVVPQVEAQLTTVLRRAPENFLALTTTCRLRYQTNRPEEAIAACNRAIAANPNYALAHMSVAVAYLYAGRAEEGLPPIQRALQLSPRDPLLSQFHHARGILLDSLGRHSESIAEFEQARQLNPQAQQSIMLLAANYAMQGRQAEAEAMLRDYMRTAPQTTVAGVRGFLRSLSSNTRFLQSREYLFEGLRRAGMPEEATPRLSFVVLPFANRSGDAEQDYFVDGLTDSLTTDLARLDGSFVISRGSAFTYKGRAADPRQVGRELGVRYVVEGSVLRSGERVRVTAQLVEAESGRTLWSDSFDGERRDMLDMVDQATARLGRALGVQAIEQASRRAEREQAQNPDAADLSLRGWASINRGSSRENLDAAETAFRAALALQPRLTAALSGLAWVQAQRLGNDMAVDRAGTVREADELVVEVLRQDPDNATTLLVQCWVQQQSDRVRESIINCQRALRANPNSAAAHYVLQNSYQIDNQPFKALEHVESAFRLSPRDPLLPSFHFVKGVDLFYLHREQEAISEFEQVRRLGAMRGQSSVYLAATYALVGRQADAEKIVAEFRLHSPHVTIANWRALMRARSSDAEFHARREKLFEGMRRAGFPEQ
jgi:TolB-like protein/class 3 adenylate cyclase/Flp pilus assembly protein TadD